MPCIRIQHAMMSPDFARSAQQQRFAWHAWQSGQCYHCHDTQTHHQRYNYPHVLYQKAPALALRTNPPRNVTASTEDRSEDAALFARVDFKAGDVDQQQDRRRLRKRANEWGS